MKKILCICIFTMFMGLAGPAFSAAPTLTPKQILAESDRARGSGPGLKWQIQIISMEDDREQSRTLGIQVKGDNSLARFTAPAKVKGQLMLMRDRNMWFIKPGLKKPVPISPRQKLMGGAANADIASTNYVKDYQILEMVEDEWDNHPCYRFDLQAVNRKVAYDRIRYWVSQTDHLGLKAEFYTTSGKMFKTATFEYGNAIELEGRKLPMVSKMIIRDSVIKANVTTLNYSDIEVKSIPDTTFNLNLIAR